MNSNITKINVVSWGTALRNAFEPGKYTFNANEIPLGKNKVTLDCKIWAKKVMAINCYFTATCPDKKFQLTVYCNFKNGTYKLPGSAVDFGTCAIDIEYDIEIKCGVNKRVMLVTATPH